MFIFINYANFVINCYINILSFQISDIDTSEFHTYTNFTNLPFTSERQPNRLIYEKCPILIKFYFTS